MNDLSKCQICGKDAMKGHIICEGCDNAYEKTVGKIIMSWNRDTNPALQHISVVTLSDYGLYNYIIICIIDRLNLHYPWLLRNFSYSMDKTHEAMQKYGFPEFTYQPKQED